MLSRIYSLWVAERCKTFRYCVKCVSAWPWMLYLSKTAEEGDISYRKARYVTQNEISIKDTIICSLSNNLWDLWRRRRKLIIKRRCKYPQLIRTHAFMKPSRHVPTGTHGSVRDRLIWMRNVYLRFKLFWIFLLLHTLRNQTSYDLITS